MKPILRALALLALAASALAQDVPKRPVASATKATWVAYATNLETVVAALKAEADLFKLDSAKLDEIISILKTAPVPTQPPPANPLPTPPVITPSNPDDAVVGSTVTFVATAEGDGLTWQWKKNYVPIAGATGATLTLAGVTADDSAIYTAVAINSAGSAEASVNLNVKPSP